MDIDLDAEDGVETDVAAGAVKGSVEVADITGTTDDDRPLAAWTDWAEDFVEPFLYIGCFGLFMACSIFLLSRPAVVKIAVALLSGPFIASFYTMLPSMEKNVVFLGSM